MLFSVDKFVSGKEFNVRKVGVKKILRINAVVCLILKKLNLHIINIWIL